MTVSADIRRRWVNPLHTQKRRLSRATKSEVIPYNKIGGYPVQQTWGYPVHWRIGGYPFFPKKSVPFLIAQRKVTINGVER